MRLNIRLFFFTQKLEHIIIYKVTRLPDHAKESFLLMNINMFLVLDSLRVNQSVETELGLSFN